MHPIGEMKCLVSIFCKPHGAHSNLILKKRLRIREELWRELFLRNFQIDVSCSESQTFVKFDDKIYTVFCGPVENKNGTD